MKKIFTSLFLLFAIAGYAQETSIYVLNLHPDTLTVSRQKDKSKISSPEVNNNGKKGRLVLPTGNLLAFKVVNGNPFKYTYVINHRVVNFFGDEPHPFAEVEAIVRPTTPSTKVDTASGREEEPITQLLQMKNFEAEGLKSLIQNTKNNAQNILGFKSANLNSAIYENRLENVEAEIKTLEELQKKEDEKAYKTKAPMALVILNKNSGIRGGLGITTLIPEKDEDEYENILNANKILLNNIQNLKMYTDEYVATISSEDHLNQTDFKQTRQELKVKHLEILSSLDQLSKEAEQFEIIKNSFQKGYQEVNTISVEIQKVLEKMYGLKLENYLIPIDVNGKNIDVVEVTMQRFLKQLPAGGNPETHTYNFWIKGGVKIDVSAGLFITSLMDEEYETVNVIEGEPEQTRQLIFENSTGDYDFGFGSTLNIGLRGASWVRPSLNIGALFTANQKFQILSGLGLVIGKEERIILQGGLAMGIVSQLSDRFVAGGSTSYDLGSAGAIPQRDKFKIGNYFGITYNLGKVRSQEESELSK